MRILLIQPDSPIELIGWGDLGAISEPLALEYIAAGVCDEHELLLLDLRLHPGTLQQTLESFKPQVAAITGYSMHVLRNLAICREIKQFSPECKTVIGGHHATLLPQDFCEPEVDFIVCGEGVGPFVKLIEQLEKNVIEPVVYGGYAKINGTHQKGPDALSFTLDTIPNPNRQLAIADRDSYFIDWMRPIALIRNTVGCPYRCSFCSLWRIMDGKYHQRMVEQVVAELASIEEEYVFLVDDEAFIDAKRMALLCDAIEKAGIRKKFFTYCRIDTLLRHPDLLARWHSIGLDRLFIGIEAIRDDQLKDYNKHLKVAQIESGLKLARDLGIKVFSGFIVHPQFQEKDFVRLVRFIEHNKIEYPSFTIWTPLPGTDALKTFDDVVELQPNGRPDWSLFDLQHCVIETRMPKKKFMRHYHDLHKTFAPSVTQYRKTKLTHREAS